MGQTQRLESQGVAADRGRKTVAAGALRQILPGINHTASDRNDYEGVAGTVTRHGLYGAAFAMKVSSTGGVGASGASRAKASGGGSSFALPSVNGASGAASVAQAGGVAGIGSLDALLALQAMGDPLERKRRAVKRADGILDILGEVKIALLDGDVSTATLDRLTRAVREQRESTDDPRLDGVLNEIETRAAVEMAKLEQARGAR